jgi:hypothetical protein
MDRTEASPVHSICGERLMPQSELAGGGVQPITALRGDMWLGKIYDAFFFRHSFFCLMGAAGKEAREWLAKSRQSKIRIDAMTSRRGVSRWSLRETAAAFQMPRACLVKLQDSCYKSGNCFPDATSLSRGASG